MCSRKPPNPTKKNLRVLCHFSLISMQLIAWIGRRTCFASWINLNSSSYYQHAENTLQTKCAIGIDLKSQFFFLLFSLFLLLFMGLIALFDTIHRSSCTISVTFLILFTVFSVKSQIFFYYLAYFYYYSWVSLHFLILFMDPAILFQLLFSFIYSTFSKFFLVLTK